MHNIIIDTNVFVSSLIQKGYPYRIVHELFIEDKIQLCTSEKLIYEYYENM
ncbi:MAG: putative toxin-antitoxin system toxin component, PIN family [Treponema sp.]|jgi:putative PIN family toxin of toxin-antitoxin system|nr:putative toxin-antitoxin system toxin component, PIN family [Treponema sp.]